jgi:hypothetical protein
MLAVSLTGIGWFAVETATRHLINLSSVIGKSRTRLPVA